MTRAFFVLVALVALAVLSAAGLIPRSASVLAQSGGAPVVCTNSVNIDTAVGRNGRARGTGSGRRQPRPQSVYECGVIPSSGGTQEVTFVAGTGTNCATGQEDVTGGAFEFADNDSLAHGSGVGWLFRTDTADALCLTTAQAVQISGVLTYTQF